MTKFPTDKQIDDLWDEVGQYFALYEEVRSTIREALKRFKTLNDTTMENETVTISKTEYDRLIESEVWEQCLNRAGVDNWEGIDYAHELYEESIKD